ncbi:MAG TPA: hypothetical protein VMT52_09395 [Planctomycetota bacterium]|nr:hypothetical protein [Planctomycetota bacterium]
MEARRSKFPRVLLATSALVVLGLLAGFAPAIAVRLQTKWRVAGLASMEEGVFERSFEALVRDPRPDVSFILCDEAGNTPSRQVYYQIVRVLHARLGLGYAPEETSLPPPDALRDMVRRALSRTEEG